MNNIKTVVDFIHTHSFLSGFNWRFSLSQFKWLVVSTANYLCAFKCTISKLLTDVQSQQSLVSRPANRRRDLICAEWKWGAITCLIALLETISVFTQTFRHWIHSVPFSAVGFQQVILKVLAEFQFLKSLKPFSQTVNPSNLLGSQIKLPRRRLIRSISRVWLVIDWLWWRSFVIHLGQRQLR